jgi:hypothetical protein
LRGTFVVVASGGLEDSTDLLDVVVPSALTAVRLAKIFLGKISSKFSAER